MNIKAKAFFIIMLCCTLMFGTQSADAYFDTQDTSCELAVNILSGLGVVGGRGDGNFGVDETLTRAEFAAMLARLLDAENVSDIPSFTDVPQSHWAAEYITAINAMGIIKGYEDGTFRPDEKIIYEQALKIVVSALGYESYAEQLGGYPIGYLRLSGSREVLRGVSGAVGQPITRGSAAILLYNATEVEILEQVSFSDKGFGDYNTVKGRTILTKYRDIVKGKGQVTGTPSTRLFDTGGTRKGTVEIDGVLCLTDDTNIYSLLGCNVVAYYYDNGRDEDFRIIYFYEDEKRTDKLAIKNTDIISLDDYTLQYYGGNGSKSAKIGRSAVVIYNGLMTQSYDLSLFKDNDGGDTTLIDTNNDGSYDVVKIMGYKNYVVSGISIADKRIFNKYVQGVYLDLNNLTDGKDYYLHDIYGQEIKIDTIAEQNVLSVFQNNGYFDITVSTASVTGEVTEIVKSNDYDEWVIGGRKITVSPSLQAAIIAGKERAVTIGDAVTLYLDMDGAAACVKMNTSVNERIGYIINTALPKVGIDKNVDFAVLDAADGVRILKASAKLKLKVGETETTLSGQSLIDALGVENGLVKRQVIIYRLNEDSEINYIELEGEGGDLRFVREVTTMYRSTPRSFGGVVNVVTDTVVFVVPQTDNTRADFEQYKARKASYFVMDRTYSVKAYNIKKDKLYADVVVTNPVVGIADGAGIAIVEKVTTLMDEDGNTTQKIYGYVNGQSAQLLVAAEGNVLSTAEGIGNTNVYAVSKGDIIRYETNEDFEVKEVQMIFDFDVGANGYVGYQRADFNALQQIVSGIVAEYSDGYIKVRMADGVITNLTDNTTIYTLGKAVVHIYNTKTNTVRIGSFGDIVDEASAGAEGATKLVLWSRYGELKDIFIYK